MILDSLILQTKLFMQEDMGIKINSVETVNEELDKLVLKTNTSMIGTGGKLNLMIVISFDESLINHLVELFMEGEEVDEEEKEEVYDSVSGETINTIIGLALPTFPNRGKGVSITPPITINDVTNMKKHKNAKIMSANVQTEHGSLSISAIGTEDKIN